MAIHHGQNLTDPAIQRCPYDFYRDLRAEEPVHLITQSGVYLVTRYDLLMTVLRDPETYSNKAQAGRRAGQHYSEAAEQLIKEKGYGRFMPTMVNNDPPSHTIYRGLVNDAFRAGRIRRIEAYIGEVVNRLIDGFAEAAECEAVADFAVPVPMYVIADQLGVPREDFKRFKAWSDAWVAGLGLNKSEAELVAAAELVVEMQHYMVARLHERRADKRDDIISDLAHASYNGERPLTDKEALSIVEQILVAGNETTTNGIANGLLFLARHPAEQIRLRQEPDRVMAFVEEILRLESPVQGLFRYVTKDTELGGISLHQGDTVMVRYAAGNRDEDRFVHAETFDPDRRNNGAHLAFGAGTHHCVGSQLARAEMGAAFRALCTRFAGFDLAKPETEIQYQASFALRGPESLHLRLRQHRKPN